MKSEQKTTSARVKKAASPSTADLRILAAEDFEPLMTKEAIRESESKYDAVWGVKRRITLYALTRSRAQLSEGMQDPAVVEAMHDAVLQVREWRTHLQAAIKLARSAEARIIGAAAVAALAEVAHG